MLKSPLTPLFVVLLFVSSALAQNAAPQGRAKPVLLSGIVVTATGETIEHATVTATTPSSEQKALTEANGEFSFKAVEGNPISLQVDGKCIGRRILYIKYGDPIENLRIVVEVRIPPRHDSVVIEASATEPDIDRRNETVYKDTLFSRDDQVFQTLDAGINAGQHEGGGKSIEVRRFGFNLDHGGVAGGLKVLVDNVQQNQGTQGHGQGYLGQLKTLTPELVQEVNILNGPFSAEYGDFSGLGVVHVRLKESLPDEGTIRLQGGSFGNFRAMLAYSPKWENADSLIAYESAHTDGPFQNPLRYQRDNVTGNLTLHLDSRRALGFKFNGGRNNFYSSGQIPLDQVAAGRLDRFGFIDPTGGGITRSGTFGAYYRSEQDSGAVLKMDGFLSRSLLDLYSNFTFYLNDPVNGDAFQQHDSRLQQGANIQYLRPHTLFGKNALFIAGSNFHANQINVGLYPRIGRSPTGVSTRAEAHVTNAAGYLQQGMDLLRGRLHLEGGLRFDYFHFNVEDKVYPDLSGEQAATRLQPKANLSFTPFSHVPFSLHFNYGRGISSQDARGIIQNPSGVKISATDFYQFGIVQRFRRFSLTADMFLIDRSNEQVYVADDGSLEFKGPSRSYGYELKVSTEITRLLSFNGGVTRVANSFYRSTFPRSYVSNAPHVVANAGLTLSQWRGFSGSVRLNYVSSYRLDELDAGIRATGLTVIDFSMLKKLRPWIDLNLSIDNLLNKTYYETQNHFESRLLPTDPAVARIHGTPGFPTGFSAGLTFHLGGK